MPPETEFLADAQHASILRKDVADDAIQPLITANLYQTAQELGPQSATLKRIANHNCKFALICAVRLDQSCHSENLAHAGSRIPVFHYKSHLTRVVDKAHARQALVGDTLAQPHLMEVPEIDALLGERLMELHHQRLVLRANRTDRHGWAILDLPLCHVLAGIRTDCKGGQLVGRGNRTMQYDASVEGDQPLTRNQQRIDLDFMNPRLLHHELAELNQDPFESGQVRRVSATNSFQRGKDPGAFHHASRQSRVERWQGVRVVAEDLYQLSARAEKQDRTKLGIHRTSDDDFVTIQCNHGLNGYPEEMLAAGLLADGGSDGVIGAAHRVLIWQIQMNAFYFRLMSYGFRE